MYKSLPTKAVKNIIDKLAEAGIYSIFFTGGEPFIRKDILELLKYAIDYGMNVTTSTNGSLITEDIANKLNKIGLDEIQVSLHGLKETHDKITGIKGAYEKTMNGIKNLIKNNVGVIVASVGMKMNYKELPQLASLLADMGVLAYRVLRLMPNNASLLNQVLDEKEALWLVARLDFVRKEKEIEIDVHVPPGCFHLKYFNPLLFPKFSHAYTSICTACKTSIAILPNGDTVPCIELKEIKLGNILYQDIEEIWNNQKCKELHELTPERYSDFCGICPFRYVCYSARCLAYRFNGSLYADDPTCVLVKASKNRADFQKNVSKKLMILSMYAHKHVLAMRKERDTVR